MYKLSKREGHLVVAAIRVLTHRDESPPRPEDVAELLGLAPAWVRMLAASLDEAGIVAIVRSAFDEHLEVRDHLKLEDLEQEERDVDLEAEFEAFDRRKAAEAEKMAQLFAEKDHERKHGDRMSSMEEQLRNFKHRKLIDPFGDHAGGPEEEPDAGADEGA